MHTNVPVCIFTLYAYQCMYFYTPLHNYRLPHRTAWMVCKVVHTTALTKRISYVNSSVLHSLNSIWLILKLFDLHFMILK